MNTVEIRPNNKLFFEPTCVVTVTGVNTILVDFYKVAGNRKTASKQFGSRPTQDLQELNKNKRAAWEAVKAFMKKQGHTDLKTTKLKY